MDEEEFRKTYDEMREYPCAFGKSLLNRACICQKAQRLNLGEREGVTCTEWQAHKRCKGVLDLMRNNARFVVKATTVPGPLPHARELRVQVGGLQGLQSALDPGSTQVIDVATLLEEALETYGQAEAFPYQTLIQFIASFKGRRRPKGRQD